MRRAAGILAALVSAGLIGAVTALLSYVLFASSRGPGIGAAYSAVYAPILFGLLAFGVVSVVLVARVLRVLSVNDGSSSTDATSD